MAKASIHMEPMKSMNVALSDENERRSKNKEWFDRAVDSKGNPYHYDWWRRSQNFEIVKGEIVPQLSQKFPLHERLQIRLRELGFNNYKTDATNTPNVCMDFVIGGDREKLRDMAFKKQKINFDTSDPLNAGVLRDKEIESWAMDTYNWAAKKYGEDNIIGFNVHLDETTPHIHMQVIPVGEVKKRGRVKPGEERGTKMAVSYSSVVGERPEDLSRYLNNLHTDYHLQVGYKYGLERGTFFDDLTPEEQATRKHRTKGEYIAWKEKEKKLKGLTTMVHNLEEKRESLLSDIATLEKDRESNTSELEEKRKQLDATTAMLNDKQEKLSEVKSELKSLDDTRNQTKEKIKVMVDDAIRRHDQLNNAIKEKRAEVARLDKTGELDRAYRHIEERDTVIFRRWPEARNAIAAIFELGNSNTATDFTPQQALDVEKAIAFSGTSRTDAAKDLLSLAQKDFDTHRTPRGWVDGAAKEVMAIARGTHQRLTALLKQQPKDSGGGPSYITDLTDWAGNQVKL